MPKIKFTKYSSTGNDFIVIDNMCGECNAVDALIWKKLCQRRFGIGADGVLFLNSSDEFDFSMRYLNADGGEVAMCGNGTRAISHFFLNKYGRGDLQTCHFQTSKGHYLAELEGNFSWIEMTEVYDQELFQIDDFFSEALSSFYVNTGVPHCVYFVDDVSDIDVVKVGREIRYNEMFLDGVNVNFISKDERKDYYQIRTYERGVEDETFACGTGALASALSLFKEDTSLKLIKFQALGGSLLIKKNDEKFFLGGETEVIYKGEVSV